MRPIIPFGLMIALGLTTSAGAEPRANARYCVEMAEQGGPAGPPQCMFETLAQCVAAKTGPSDRCMLNPWFAVRERNR